VSKKRGPLHSPVESCYRRVLISQILMLFRLSPEQRAALFSPLGVLFVGAICGYSQGIFTTIAGTDWVFPSPVPAIDAPLGRMQPVAVDTNGNVYAADSDNNIVVRMSTTGLLAVVAGNGQAGFSGDGGPATSASLYYPQGVAGDADDNLYIADTANQRVRKVTRGTIATIAGNGQGGFSGDGGPALMAEIYNPGGLRSTPLETSISPILRMPEFARYPVG